jgi:hypothetical protein
MFYFDAKHCSMAFLPTLLSCLALLTPSEGSTASDLPRVNLCSLLNLGWDANGGDLIEGPADFPPHSERLLERPVETALDEEDSTQVEDRGIVPSVLLDDDATLAPLLSHLPAPISGSFSGRLTSPILRC